MPNAGAAPVLSGRDLESGGTWLGLTAQGRLALLTNVRGTAPHDPQAPSRGSIALDWLSARETTGNFWMRTAMSGHNGFNLLAADFVRSARRDKEETGPLVQIRRSRRQHCHVAHFASHALRHHQPLFARLPRHAVG